MTWSSTGLVELDVTFRAVDVGPSLGYRLPELFAAAWPSYRAWFLTEGEPARSSYAEGVAALRHHMPELAGTYDALVEAVGGGDLEARFLSHWCPPPLATACSLGVWNREQNVLVRNYDFPPQQCDTTLLASEWVGPRVLAMSDCLWGAVDGINEHGLAVAIAFGGRTIVGPGFGVGLVVRYLLEVARSVPEALEILDRVPVSMAYNVALLDRSGCGAIVAVSPDQPPTVTPRFTAANRQGATEWPEHAAMCGTVEREAALVALISEPSATLTGMVATFLQPPVWRDPATTPWGTVYTAAYDCDRGAVDLRWPDDVAWSFSMHGAVEGVRTRHLSLVPPPTGASPYGDPWALPVYAGAFVQ